MSSKISAVIFDMDGLMFDTESAYSVVHGEMSQKRDKIFTNEVKMKLMGKRANEVMSILNDFWGKEEDVEDLLREQDLALVDYYKTSVEKLSGLNNLLNFLNKNDIRKCIGTSSRRFLVDVLLHKFNLENEFEFVVSGDMVENGKPDPEIYDRCLSQLNLEGTKCLVLEDSLNGIRSGVSAGCFTCAIPSKYTKDEDFSQATIIAKSLDDKIILDFLL